MPVGEMLQRMTSMELTEWMAYFSIRDEKVPVSGESALARMRSFFHGKIIKKKK